VPKKDRSFGKQNQTADGKDALRSSKGEGARGEGLGKKKGGGEAVRACAMRRGQGDRTEEKKRNVEQLPETQQQTRGRDTHDTHPQNKKGKGVRTYYTHHREGIRRKDESSD